jgi:nucleoside-diphosphate-sugar epimerase
MTKILITGGGGFIGEHLSRGLITQGIPHSITDIDRPNIIDNTMVKVHVGNILDAGFLSTILKDYDTIIHLAGRTGGGQYDDPLSFFLANAESTVRLMMEVRTAGLKKMIVASSYEVYGIPQGNPINENHIVAPTTPYGASMTARENMARILGKNYGINTIVLRFFTVYGNAISSRNQKGGIASFYNLLKAGREPVITSSLLDERDYIHVDDVVRIMIDCIFSNSIADITMNVGTGTGIPLEIVLRELSCYFPGYNPPKQGELLPLPPRGISVVADTTMMKRYFPHQQMIDFKTGIKSFVNIARTNNR